MSHALKRLARESVSWTNPEINVQAKTYMKKAQKVTVFDGIRLQLCYSGCSRRASKNKKKIRFLKIKKANSNFSF